MGGEREKALDDALKALSFIDERIRLDFFGELAGTEIVGAGLDAMASSLVRLFDIPGIANAQGEQLDEVLAYLAARKRVDGELAESAADLAEALRLAGYKGLDGERLAEAEKARQQIYDALVELLSEEARSIVDE